MTRDQPRNDRIAEQQAAQAANAETLDQEQREVRAHLEEWLHAAEVVKVQGLGLVCSFAPKMKCSHSTQEQQESHAGNQANVKTDLHRPHHSRR